MFYLKHKTTGEYFNYDDITNEILWVSDKKRAFVWNRECDALFVQHFWDDEDLHPSEPRLWEITKVVEE